MEQFCFRRLGFPFRILFFVSRNTKQSKQKAVSWNFACFAKHKKQQNLVSFRFVSWKVKFRFVIFSSFVTWIPFTFVMLPIFSCFAFLSKWNNCCCILMFNFTHLRKPLQILGLGLIRQKIFSLKMVMMGIKRILFRYRFQKANLR
jgi:hypothetical protein